MNDITEVDRLNAKIADLKKTIEWYQGRTGIMMGAAAGAALAAAPASEPVAKQFRERMNDGTWGKWHPYPDEDVLIGLIAADHEVRELYAAAPAPVSGMPDLASLPIYERPKRGWQGVWNTAPNEKFYFVADVERLLNPTGETK